MLVGEQDSCRKKGTVFWTLRGRLKKKHLFKKDNFELGRKGQGVGQVKQEHSDARRKRGHRTS